MADEAAIRLLGAAGGAREFPGRARFSLIGGYVAREFLFGFFVCFLFFFAVFFVNQILLMADDILSRKAQL